MKTKFGIVLLMMGMVGAGFAQSPSATTATLAVAQPRSTTTLRVASYNIPFLNTQVPTQGARLQNLHRVIEAMDADIVALQEVADRAAVNLVFPPEKWQVVIDDDSADNQDLACAVRKPLEITNIPTDLDPEDEHFLFSGSQYESAYPNRRDALLVSVAVPGTSASIDLVTVHSKSRLGGRHNTDPRREEAAKLMVEKLRTFEGRNMVILGDFNDNPDDRSLNILETGDPNASGGAEEEDGPLMVNLMEPLVAQDMVSHGAHILRQTADGLLDVQVPGSRERNNRYRGRGTHTGPILFDQILVTMPMKDAVVSGSTTIFRQPVALEGEGRTRPSDHLPVYTDIDTTRLPGVK